MNRNSKAILIVLIVALLGWGIYYAVHSKSTQTEEEKRQALIDSITPTSTKSSLSEQETKALIDSITPR